jgi:putative transposase
MGLVEAIASRTGVRRACESLGVAPASYYRSRAPKPRRPRPRRPAPPRALAPAERAQVLEVLHSPRFVDAAPAAVHAALLEDGTWHCSVRTMYRILAAADEVRERRHQLRHPVYKKPELLATGPNQVWSWDLTKLRAAAKWTYYSLYVLLDIYSRYVVGWMLAHRESGQLARQLVAQTCEKQHIDPEQLTIHADRGAAPTSKTLAQLYADLGVSGSHSRPHVSNDNPYSEAQFKTMKYRGDYPERFGSYEHALSHCRNFFPWYNRKHRHSGIAMLTPEIVHHGRAEAVLAARQHVLDEAYDAHPERFVNGRPTVQVLPPAVWINPPEDKARGEIELH